MNHIRSFPVLVTRQTSLLNQFRFGTTCINNLGFHNSLVTLQKRSYRFGRKAEISGFSVSPKWFEREFLKNTNDQVASDNIFNNHAIINQTNKLFNEEKERQKMMVNRIDKIEIQLEKPFPKGEDYILMMNQNLSTPYDCASHISQLVRERSALALVDGNKLWEMHQPLEKSCHVRLLHYMHPDATQVNYAFWRSCSMLLASVVKKAFKDQFSVQIISQPFSDLNGGSFVCDAVIPSLTDWNVTSDEIRVFTSLLWEEVAKNQIFERLQVSLDLVNHLFEDRPNRLSLIASKIKNENKDSFVVHRVGDYIELCDEPMIANTNQIGSIYLSSIHPLKTPNGSPFYRFQGIALPKQLHINPFVFTIIRDRAKTLNRIGLN